MAQEARRMEKGQSTLEYILVLAAIIAAVAIAANTALTNGITKSMTNAGGAVENAADQLTNRLK